MKSMKCNELGGACELEFKAETFAEIAEMSKKHGMEMYKAGDAAHLQAMNAMREKMSNPEVMQAWFQSKKEAFEALPEL